MIGRLFDLLAGTSADKYEKDYLDYAKDIDKFKTFVTKKEGDKFLQYIKDNPTAYPSRDDKEKALADILSAYYKRIDQRTNSLQKKYQTEQDKVYLARQGAVLASALAGLGTILYKVHKGK